MVMGAEFLVDWIKHAFITRFNEVDADVYKSYTIFLAYDLAQTKQKHVNIWWIFGYTSVGGSQRQKQTHHVGASAARKQEAYF